MRQSLIVLFLLFTHWLTAQVCTGSLGQNIFNDGDFGSGLQTTLPSDPGYAPGYQYTTTVPFDGEYSITKNTAALAGLFPSWLIVGDNSGTDDGYFMVVNASFAPGLFYSEVIDGLCESTLYEFSADVINLIQADVENHIQPNVDFLINGEVVFSTGIIPQSERWTTYGFTFVTEPDETSLTLSLRNNAPGGQGNDLGLDNIAFRPCGPTAIVEIGAGETTFLCFDDSPQVLTADVMGDSRAIQWQLSRDAIQWQDIAGSMGPTYTHNDFTPGSYYYRYLSAGTEANLSNVRCRVQSDVVRIEVLPEVYEIEDTLCDGLTYSFGGEDLSASGTYSTTMISSKGCDSTTTLDLTVVPYIPSTAQVTTVDPSCPGLGDGSITIEEVMGGYGGHDWQLGAIAAPETTLPDLSAGSYDLVIVDQYGCSTTQELEVVDPEVQKAEIIGGDTYAFGDTVQLTAQLPDSVSAVRWSFLGGDALGDSTSLVFVASRDASVVLSVDIAEGCRIADTLLIEVAPPILPVLPNAISPNGDGLNDQVVLNYRGATVLRVDFFGVYDRWGNEVTTQYSQQPRSPLTLWDGTFKGRQAMSGVYTYRLRMTLADGSPYTLQGSLMVLR